MLFFDNFLGHIFIPFSAGYIVSTPHKTVETVFQCVVLKPHQSLLPPYPPTINRCCCGPKSSTYNSPVLTKPNIARGKGDSHHSFNIWGNKAAEDLQQWETLNAMLYFQFGVSSWCCPERVHLCHLCTLLRLWLKIHIQYDPHSWNRS